MIRTIGYDQLEILDNIRELHCDGVFEVDASYGNGKFYTGREKPEHCFDLDPNLSDCTTASSSAIPLGDSSVGSIVFDPPFLTYVKGGRGDTSVMAKRFSGYWRYDELETHYRESLAEFSRVLRRKGVVVFKCQDIIHNHKLHPTHINVVGWANEVGFRLKDLFVLAAKHRMPQHKVNGVRPKQKHARVFHSYFLVLEKVQHNA